MWKRKSRRGWLINKIRKKKKRKFTTTINSEKKKRSSISRNKIKSINHRVKSSPRESAFDSAKKERKNKNFKTAIPLRTGVTIFSFIRDREGPRFLRTIFLSRFWRVSVEKRAFIISRECRVATISEEWNNRRKQKKICRAISIRIEKLRQWYIHIMWV